MSAPWMASQYPSQAQIESFEGSVFAERFKGILGACRSKAAASRLERRYADLIETYQEDEGEDYDLPDQWPYVICLHRRIC